MLTLNILAQPRYSLFSELYPFYRWKDQLKGHGIKVQIFNDATDKKLRGADCLLIQSKHFSKGWQNVLNRTDENESNLVQFLQDIKKDTGKLIWFDQSDSTGVQDFSIIQLVDSFVVKQMLKNLDYYAEPDSNKNSRVWLNREMTNVNQNFVPCPKDNLHKIKLGWNIGFNDYRQFLYKFKKLSNHIGHAVYPLNVTSVKKPRQLDLSFRGKIKYDKSDLIAIQRNKILELLDSFGSNFIISKGAKVSRRVYLNELRNSKVSISPFGYGEVCYRDFESLIAGALLIKPSMDHLTTFPNIYIPNETYIPISWDISDLKEKFEDIINNYQSYQDIAICGQQRYLTVVNDSANFIEALKKLIY